MKDEKTFQYKLLALICLIIISGLVTIYYIDRLLKDSVARELKIATNIGEIGRLDEVLTMSAKLYTSSNDVYYKQRYEVNADKLAEIISTTFTLIQNHDAISYLQKTEAANESLIKLELEAFRLCQQSLCNQAYDLLHQQTYKELKVIYKEGMDQALQYLSSISKLHTKEVKYLFILIVICLIVAGLVLTFYLYIHHKNKIRLDMEEAQHEALMITLSTVMDTCGNALNQLMIFQITMNESSDFSDEDIREFDDIIFNTRNKLDAMANMPAFKSRKSSVYDFLDYPTNAED